MESQHWIRSLDLQPHPEGGYYREIYRSSGTICRQVLSGAFKGDRSYATSIYYLLEDRDFSAFHRIPSDEIWHFYDGTGLEIIEIDEGGGLRSTQLGRSPEKGVSLCHVVSGRRWFAARIPEGVGYALVGCTVAPGFDFEDFEMARRPYLIATYPQHAEIIRTLTR